MFFIELFTPPGALSPEQRTQIAERLSRAVVTAAEAAAETVDATQAATDVVVHEPAAWVVRGRRIEPDRPPRYLVRVSVPGAWRKELSEHLTTRITQVLAEAEDDPERLYREPDAVVQVVGVPEGGYGLLGRTFGANDLAELLSAPYRAARRAGTAQEPPPGRVADPVCGAILSLDDEATVVLERDGVTYGFCCKGCRTTFVAEQDAAGTVS